METINPCIKWAGGKTQLIGEIQKRAPQKYNRYFEPFIGSAAVLFSFQPENAYVNDFNDQLINLYIQLRDNVELVIDKLAEYEEDTCSKTLYYSLRDSFNNKIANKLLDFEAAALFIYINKHCFNGLYRVNSKGLFNVPWNQRTSAKSAEPNNLRSISKYLKNVQLSNKDFESFCEDVKEGDFVYFDSPYVPESDTASFTSYTAGGFTYDDHVRLANLFDRLSERGALLMLSNNDVSLVHDLYGKYKIEPLDVKRMINRDADKRTGHEVIITNY